MHKKTAIIIGAGPAGLTAAYELLTRTDIKPIIIEKSDTVGGLAKTLEYKGNKIDIGPHRFFSKSDRVMQWWLDMLPLQATKEPEQAISYQNKTRSVKSTERGPKPDDTDHVMLLVERQTRIYFLRKFFNYPVSLSKETLLNLGPVRTVRIGLSYLKSALFPIKDEKNLEQFFINRFGKELYLTFFKSYTEKVWGMACDKINADWGAQRIKGLSVAKTIKHVFAKALSKRSNLGQKQTETSLIEQFLYPKLGAGQIWEEAARQIVERGGEIITGFGVDKMFVDGGKLKAIEAVSADGLERRVLKGDYFFSTMPMKELVKSLQTEVPETVARVGNELVYRDFIQVSLLLKRMAVKDRSMAKNGNGQKGGEAVAAHSHGANGHANGDLIKDNWIYLQEPDILAGRMQICNNMSPYLLANPSNVWIGVEYFCYQTDDIWQKSDDAMKELAVGEMSKIGMIDGADVLDAMVTRVEKTYPAYFGSYDQFEMLREYLDGFENLFLVGRNGMHKYNNQDHSMLTAMTAVDNIVEGRVDKANIWAVNTEQEYHETKTEAQSQPVASPQVAPGVTAPLGQQV